MVNHYIFDEDNFVLVDDGVYEIVQLRTGGGKLTRVTLTREELPETCLMDLYYQENEKLHMLWEEYIKVLQDRDKILALISDNKNLFPDEEIEEIKLFGKDINERLRYILYGEKET